MALGPYLLGRIASLENEVRQCEENALTHERDAERQRRQAKFARKMAKYLRKSETRVSSTTESVGITSRINRSDARPADADTPRGK